MADLKQMLEGKKIVQKEPVLISMDVKELGDLIDSMRVDLVERIEKLEQQVLLLGGKMAVALGDRSLDDEEKS